MCSDTFWWAGTVALIFDADSRRFLRLVVRRFGEKALVLLALVRMVKISAAPLPCGVTPSWDGFRIGGPPRWVLTPLTIIPFGFFTRLSIRSVALVLRALAATAATATVAVVATTASAVALGPIELTIFGRGAMAADSASDLRSTSPIAI